MDTTSLMVGGLVGVVGGLSKDIIFSWLNIGRTNQPMSEVCSDHRERLARVDERLGACELAVSKWSRQFQSIQETMDTMNQTLAVLLDRSNRRRGGEGDNG